MISGFYAYYLARKFENLSDDDRFLPVFASSDIKVHPFQIAAASFALRSPYQKGIILCDEAGMGKSHETMLVIAQSFFEGKNHILLVMPNADLLSQWVEMIEEKYTVPFAVITNKYEWQENTTDESPNAFEQDALVITTTDFIFENVKFAKLISWDIAVFEEANYLCPVYTQDGGKQAKTLKEIASGSFKILLTGTPIEKNIMDLYGLIYFIDENILPDSDSYMKRYLRKPENYPELAEKVSKYCFRTLRSQAKQYAKIPNRIHITIEYNKSEQETKLYNLLWQYINKENKIAFPQMDIYDLSLMLLGSLGSSTKAVLKTINNIIARLNKTENSTEEITQFLEMQRIAESIRADSKAKELLLALHKIFPILKKLGANKKAVIFTESVETAKMLYNLLSDKYRTLLYGSGANYNAIKTFKTTDEVLISTDIGAKGFNLEESSLIVNYDLLYNTLKMEQRIDRCHRLNQQNDVIVLSFIDKNNSSDVRKLELVSKRHILAHGVFGVSDSVLGGFTDDLDKTLKELEIRTKQQVDRDYLATLDKHKAENKEMVENAEDILFTTFTKKLADKVKITPKYIEEKSKEINSQLWQVVTSFIGNDENFHIDEKNKIITALTEKPFLFYYWSGSGNKKYFSAKQYKMPQITLTSVLGRGVIHNIECADLYSVEFENNDINCTIALYSVEIMPSRKSYPIFIGKTMDGSILTHRECEDILSKKVKTITQSEGKTSHWLRTNSSPFGLDRYIDINEFIKKESDNLTDLQKEEIERIKLTAKSGKNALHHAIDDVEKQVNELETQIEENKTDRMKTLTLERKLTLLKQELMKKKEKQFFEEMQIDVELENRIKEFLEKQKVTGKVIRQFIINVQGV